MTDAARTGPSGFTQRLKGRRAIIWGAGSGIGRAVAEAFLREGAGVIACEMMAEKCAALKTGLPAARVFQGDIRRVEDCSAAVAACRDLGWDGLDVLVNCVGIFDHYLGLSQIDADRLEAGFDEIMHANVLGGLLSVRQALPMLRQARGSVILTGSSSGFYPGRGGVLYLASKFAIRGCVAALAHELAPEVRVNGVAPGGVLGSDIRMASVLGMADVRIPADEGRIADLKRLTPLQLAMTPEEIAGSYVFLASGEACGFTGQFLHPDGGMAVRG